MKRFLKAVTVKGRIIHALFVHTLLSEHGKSKIGYLTAIIKPLGQIVMLSTMFTVIGRRVGIGDNLVLFLTTGVVTYNLCVGLANKMLRINKAPKKILDSTTATPFDFSIAFLLSETVIIILASILILAGLGNFGYWDHRVDSLLGILLTALLSIALGYGVGLLNLALATISPSYEKVWKILTMPLFIMSGVIFIADQRFPPEVLAILRYNPLLHIIESMRSNFYRTWDSSLFDLSYVLWFTSTTLFLGLALQRLTQNREKK